MEEFNYIHCNDSGLSLSTYLYQLSLSLSSVSLSNTHTHPLSEQISEKCTEKLVEEFNYIHCNDSGLSLSLYLYQISLSLSVEAAGCRDSGGSRREKETNVPYRGHVYPRFHCSNCLSICSLSFSLSLSLFRRKPPGGVPRFRFCTAAAGCQTLRAAAVVEKRRE